MTPPADRWGVYSLWRGEPYTRKLVSDGHSREDAMRIRNILRDKEHYSQRIYFVATTTSTTTSDNTTTDTTTTN